MSNPPAKPTTTVDGQQIATTEPSVGELVTSAMHDVSALIQSEIQLAKAELTVSVKNGGLAAGLFAAAGFLLLMSVIMLSVAFAYLIHLTGLDLAFCFLIVWFVYTAIAGLLGFIGYKRIRIVGPPKRTIEQAKETKEALLHRS